MVAGEVLGMGDSRTAEDRVLERLFQRLQDDPTLPKSTLERLERARNEDKLTDVREVLAACLASGGGNAKDKPS